MRKFGAELELGLQSGRSLEDVSRALSAAGLGGVYHRYEGHSDTSWIVKLDASLTHGVEIVSPPLDFDDPTQRGQIDRVLAAVKDLTRPSRDAGIHVHVDSHDLDAKQVAAVSRLFTRFEDVLYRLASSGWETIRPGAASMAKPLPFEVAQRIAKAKTPQQLSRAYYGSNFAPQDHGHRSRYYGLNLHSHFYRGTIEFRVFNSSLNVRRVQTYVAVCVAMVQDARNGHSRSIARHYELGSMLAKENEGDTQFSRSLVGQFVNTLRVRAGLSAEDQKNVRRLWKDSKPQARIIASQY